jgi:hypothetical protein
MFLFLAGAKQFSSPEATRPDLGPTQLAIQQAPGVKQLKSEVEINNEWRYAFSPLTCLHDVH